jgi:hypothetical protein
LAVFWFRRGRRVLTIGSVHLDTIALSNSAGQSSVGETEIGSIIHSVGGSAFNIAANLALHRRDTGKISAVAIYSILPQHSVLTEIITYKINASGASSRFLSLYGEFQPASSTRRRVRRPARRGAALDPPRRRRRGHARRQHIRAQRRSRQSRAGHQLGRHASARRRPGRAQHRSHC